MNKIKQFLITSLIAISPSCFAQENTTNQTLNAEETKHEFRYTNPITRDSAISMRDHFIIKVGSKWY